MKRFNYLVCICNIYLLCMVACTDNPLFEDKIEIEENNRVKGKVNLGYGVTPSDVYVWLEGFNISDWTDDDGNFIIELPPAETQAGSGLNGIYSLYIYTANYQYERFNLLLLNGEFKYNTEILDINGNFKQTIILKKLLDITTTVVPTQIESTNQDTINFIIRLESTMDSVLVRTHFNKWHTPSSLIFLKEKSPNDEAILIQGIPAILRTTVIKNVIFWPTSFIFPSDFFDNGIYQVSPYVQILQEGLPNELLLSIDENIFELNHHYLNWPMKQQPGFLTVEGLSE